MTPNQSRPSSLPEAPDLREQLRVARATIAALEETLAEREDDVARARIDAVADASHAKRQLAEEVTRLHQEAPLYERRIARLKERLSQLGDRDPEHTHSKADTQEDTPDWTALPMAEAMEAEISRLRQGYDLMSRHCEALEEEIERLLRERNDAISKARELKHLFALLESHRPDLFKDLPPE